MKFTLAASAFFFASFTAANYGGAALSTHSQAPVPAPAPSGRPAPMPMPRPQPPSVSGAMFYPHLDTHLI